MDYLDAGCAGELHQAEMPRRGIALRAHADGAWPSLGGRDEGRQIARGEIRLHGDNLREAGRHADRREGCGVIEG